MIFYLFTYYYIYVYKKLTYKSEVYSNLRSKYREFWIEKYG